MSRCESGVLFPGMSLPITAARAVTIRAVEAALRDPEHRVFVVAQRGDDDDVTPDDLYTTGTDRHASAPCSAAWAASAW